MMNNREKLIEYRGYLKFQKEKNLKYIDLIDFYIQRIDENTAEVKDSDRAEIEEKYNKDLLKEVECLIEDIKY